MKMLHAACVAMLAVFGIGATEAKPEIYNGPAYHPRRDGANFRTRRVEYKDEPANLAGKIAEQLKELGERVNDLVHANKEQKDFSAAVANLAEDTKSLKADLAEFRKSEPELKSFLSKATDRLDDFEKRINAFGVTAAASNGGKTVKRYAECKSLDVAMRAHEHIEMKSLDSDLKVQNVFHDTVVTSDFPLLDMAYRKPTNSDAPRWSYPSGMVVGVKGGASATPNARNKVVGAVVDYEYQPTLDKSDVDDTGSFLLDDETATFVEGMRAKLEAVLVDAIEAKLHLAAGLTEFTDVLKLKSGTEDTWAATDLDTIIAALPKRYRKGAVFIGSAAMTVILSGFKDATTGVSMWRPGLAAGVPATLMGYTYIEDENLAANRLVFGNPRWGLRIGERQAPSLSNIERLGGDYKPYFSARYDAGVLDTRAWVAMDIKNDA